MFRIFCLLGLHDWTYGRDGARVRGERGRGRCCHKCMKLQWWADGTWVSGSTNGHSWEWHPVGGLCLSRVAHGEDGGWKDGPWDLSFIVKGGVEDQCVS